MEHVWVEDCPAIVLFQSNYITAYRTDSFEGIIIDSFKGAPNFYTNLRIHLLEGDVLGGTYTWANPLDTLSFNHFSVNHDCADNILDMLFDPLVRIDPNGNDIPWMCLDYSVETHLDNPDVQEGHTEIIVDIINNASWSDSTPVTANDFAFSILFIRDNIPELAIDLEALTACYAYTPSRLFCEFNTESYWHWHSIAYKYVIPEQIWAEYDPIYYEYQPSPLTIQEMVVSGPFIPTTWVQGDFVELSANDNYWKNPRLISTQTPPPDTIVVTTATSTSTSTTSTTTFTAMPLVYSWIWIAIVVFEVGLCIYIVTTKRALWFDSFQG